MQQGQRQLGTGVSTIASNSTVTLATLTRHANECLSMLYFALDNTAGLRFGADISDGISLWLERTAVQDQFVLMGHNEDNHSDHTVQWCIIGVIPT